MRQRILFHLLWLAAFIGAGCNGRPAPLPDRPTSSITIFTAASTKDVIEQLAKSFEREHGDTVTVVPGPSSGLAKQIEQGGKADLFLSADEASADFLAKKGMVAERHDLLTNRLVVIVPADSDLKITELADLASPAVKHLAVAEAKVPAGEYARQALKKSGVLERVGERFVGGVDVRQTLTFVARGEAEAGFVYLTDTIANSRVRVAYEVPADLHEPIVYPLVLLKPGTEKPGAVGFMEYLRSPLAAEAFRAARFGLAK